MKKFNSIYKKLLKEYIDDDDDEDISKYGVLYHATNIKHLEDIKKYGLIPDIGDTIKTAYTEHYDFNNEDTDEDTERQKVPDGFDGILFFSEKPNLRYSQPLYTHTYIHDKCLLCVVNRDSDMYKLVSSYPLKVLDYKNREIKNDNRHVPFDITNLPAFIEKGDWFSLEKQTPIKLLHGDELDKYMKEHFNTEYQEYIKK